MSFPDISLPFVTDDAELRAAVDAAGSTAKADLTGPAADLAACHAQLRAALGKAMQ
jgi:hypothetical protein